MSTPKKKLFLLGMALSAAVAVAGCAGHTDRQRQASDSDIASVASNAEPAHIVDTVTRRAVYDGSFRSELTEAEQVVYDAMVQHFVVERKSNEDRLYIDAAAIGVGQPGFRIGSTLKIATDAFLVDYPEIFWATYESYDVEYDENNEIKSASPRFSEYYGKYSEAETVMRGIDEAVETIKEMRKSESRYDTVKAIHNYICQTVEYDLETYGYNGQWIDPVQEAFTVIPTFGGGPRKYRVVCEGYAKSFKALCNRLDVPCVLISGDEVLEHAWNMVQMDDGIWYGLDTTWDDVRNGSPIYTYFLFGKNTPAIRGNHSFDEIAATGSGGYDSDQPFFYNPVPVAEEKYQPGN